MGHLDTVPAHPNDREPRIEGERVFGLGSSDMKGGERTSVPRAFLGLAGVFLAIKLFERVALPAVWTVLFGGITILFFLLLLLFGFNGRVPGDSGSPGSGWSGSRLGASPSTFPSRPSVLEASSDPVPGS